MSSLVPVLGRAMHIFVESFVSKGLLLSDILDIFLHRVVLVLTLAYRCGFGSHTSFAELVIVVHLLIASG